MHAKLQYGSARGPARAAHICALLLDAGDGREDHACALSRLRARRCRTCSAAASTSSASRFRPPCRRSRGNGEGDRNAWGSSRSWRADRSADRDRAGHRRLDCASHRARSCFPKGTAGCDRAAAWREATNEAVETASVRERLRDARRRDSERRSGAPSTISCATCRVRSTSRDDQGRRAQRRIALPRSFLIEHDPDRTAS